jgi:Polypeptide deformylase
VNHPANKGYNPTVARIGRPHREAQQALHRGFAEPVVTGLDADGEPVTVEGTGLIARMLQHEIGHLDGQLYIDRLVAPYAARAADAVTAHGWGVPGLTWTPGVDPNPFGV